MISEELCDDFAHEFRKLDRQIWDKNHPSLSGGEYANYGDGGADFRNTIQGFVANCRRRAIYEEELRKERGLSDETAGPVIIPPHGVPRDIPVSLDDLLGAEGEEVGAVEGSVDDGYFDTYFDNMDGDGKEHG